jgi:hypothetical protein
MGKAIFIATAALLFLNAQAVHAETVGSTQQSSVGHAVNLADLHVVLQSLRNPRATHTGFPLVLAQGSRAVTEGGPPSGGSSSSGCRNANFCYDLYGICVRGCGADPNREMAHAQCMSNCSQGLDRCCRQ